MSWEKVVLPLIGFAFLLASIMFLHKGWTYSESDRKYVDNANPNNGSILDELLQISSILPIPIARIIYLSVGAIYLFTSLLLNYFVYTGFFSFTNWLAIIIVAIITLISTPLGIKLRKKAEPSDEAIDDHIQQILSCQPIRRLYENEDYTFLFHHNYAIRSWLFDVNLKKLQENNLYLQKIEKELLEKLVSERMCTPSEERGIDESEKWI
ncbi:hypothetical protein H839_06639 [Parageobacillus genomosp. 1]|uniref:Uncharacterized protein n=1 Tax=Parageobacillus genomosp. 1 TaxID=1295642 RepID=A0ABC9VFF8_9BACL|nr:hypothetical protein [Parageobacillus genomosp. 1]EZP77295.1 hypothetical protein H839_06639 [Parageobacillus genomosp. 1]